MINFHTLFNDFFDDDDFSLTELAETGGLWVGRLTGLNPGGVFTARANALQAALSSLEANTTDAGVKLGLQKSATANKKLFRKSLQENMSKVQLKVVLQYGKSGPVVLEIFPKGMAPFQADAAQEPLENELGVVLAGVTAHAAELPAGLVTDVGSYLSSWLLIYGASKSSQIAKTTSNLSGGDLRKALQLELTKTVLFVAFTYPEDHAKCDYYLPTEKLFNPQAHPPGACSIEATGGDGQISVTGHASGADTIAYASRLAGSSDPFAPLGSSAPDEEVTFDTLPPGSYELKGHGVNAEGNGPDSDVATVTVT
jgi:hypothetical protein